MCLSFITQKHPHKQPIVMVLSLVSGAILYMHVLLGKDEEGGLLGTEVTLYRLWATHG